MTTIKPWTKPFQSSSLAGEFPYEVTYLDLVQILGEPHHTYDENSGDKVDFEWELDVDGVLVTVYNYKTGPAYGDIDAIAIEDHRGALLHIGGDRDGAQKLIEYVLEEIEDAKVSEAEDADDDRLGTRVPTNDYLPENLR